MRKSRIESMDAVRAFACLSVLGYHMYICELGHLGAAVFFMLSGFLSAYNYLDTMDTDHITLKGCAKFSYSKLTKFYPLYFVMLLIPFAGQAYGALNGLTSWGKVLAKLAVNALLVQSWIPVNEFYFSLNFPAWFLSSLGFAYFMLPYILRWIKKLGSIRAALITAFAIWAVQILAGSTGVSIYKNLVLPNTNVLNDFICWFTYVFPVFRLADFYIGAIMAYVFLNRKEDKISGVGWTVAEVGAILFAAAVQAGIDRGIIPFNYTVSFLPCCAALIYTFATNRGYISKLLTNRVVKYIADISSEVFLTHAVVIFVCTPIIERLPLGAAEKRAVYIAGVLALTFVAATLGRRFNNAINSKRKARSAA